MQRIFAKIFDNQKIDIIQKIDVIQKFIINQKIISQSITEITKKKQISNISFICKQKFIYFINKKIKTLHFIKYKKKVFEQIHNFFNYKNYYKCYN